MVQSKDINFLIDFGNALEGSGIYSSATRLAKGLIEHNFNVKINSHSASAIVHTHTALPISFIKVKRILSNRKKDHLFPILIAHGHTTIEDFVNSFLFSNQMKFILRYYLPSFYKSFDKIIAVSQHNKQLLMNYGIREEKIAIISNGIKIKTPALSSKLREATRTHLGLKEDEKLIICIGICIYRKGIDRFIDIAQKMPEHKFIWIGKRTPTPFLAHASYLKKKYKEAKKLKNCQFPGYVSYKTLLGIINASDLFLYPTREENQGIAFLEAILYNKPSIISNHPVFDEFKDNEHVLKASTIDEFVEKISMVFDDDNLAKSLVSNSKKYLEIHDLENSINKLASLYSELLQASAKI
jgi:1,2-diacylglycerol-3-alpha-glucose alpha-1,2-glucosyltransferase